MPADPRLLDSARLDAASMALSVPRTSEVPEILTGSRGALTVSFRAKGGVGCSIEVALATPLSDTLLKILPTTSVDPEGLRDGMTVDVLTSDAAFDAQFHVEGAPSDVVRAVLDDGIRRWMIAHPDSTLQLMQDARVRVVVENLPPDEIASAIDQVVAFASEAPARARQAVHDRDAAPAHGSGYRGLPDADTAQAAHVVGQLEVARLREELRSVDRRTSRWLVASLVATAVPLFWFAPIWVALMLVLPATLIMAMALGLLGIAADSLGVRHLRRWGNRRRRARFERKFTPQLPPGDF